MQSLGSALLDKQKSGIGLDLRVKCALTHPTLDNYTYYSNDRVARVKEHVEDYWSQHAIFELGNWDQALSAIDLRGYQAVLSYGYDIGTAYVADPGFEAWDDASTLTNYDIVTGTITRESTVVHEGTYSCELDTGANSSIKQELSGWDNSWRGKTAIISGWIWSAEASSAHLGLYDDDSGYSYADYHDGDSAWTRFSVAHVIGDAATKLWFVASRQSGSGKVYVDGYIELKILGLGAENISYAARAPLWILPETYRSSMTGLKTTLMAVGIPNLLARDKASTKYAPRFTESADAPTSPTPETGDYWKDTDTSTWYQYNGATWGAQDPPTVKDLISDILDASHASFDHCYSWTVNFDSEDDNIDSVMPLGDFKIYPRMSRRACVKQLLTKYTKCIMRGESDGEIHILLPTTTGTTYDYQYKATEADYHHHAVKTLTNELVFPNKIVCSTYPEAANAYTGNASITGYASLPSQMQNTNFVFGYFQSNQECTDVAEAQIAQIELQSQTGGLYVPLMNIGQQVGDYVKGWDSRENQNVVGNVGRMTFRYDPGTEKGHTAEYSLTIEFGYWDDVQKLEDVLSDSQQWNEVDAMYVHELQVDQIEIFTLDEISDGDTYSRVLSTHIDAGQIVIDSAIQYAANYDPTDKLDKTNDDLDDVLDGTSYSRVATTAISGGLIKLSTGIVTSGQGEWYDESGVVIDASAGVTVYGTDAAFRTRATKDGSDVCKVGSDGHIVIYGGSLDFYETGGAGSTIGKIYTDDGNDYGTLGDMILFPPTGVIFILGSSPTIKTYNTADLIIDPAGGDLTIDANVSAGADNENLGTSSKSFDYLHLHGVMQFHASYGGANTGSIYESSGNLTLTPSGYVVVSGKLNVTGECEIDGNLNHDGSYVGFFGTTPATQGSAIADLTLITDVTGVQTCNLTYLATDFSYIQNKINEIIHALERHGLIAS